MSDKSIDKLAEQSEIERLKAVNAELLAALSSLQQEVYSAVRFDVKKHYSLRTEQAGTKPGKGNGTQQNVPRYS